MTALEKTLKAMVAGECRWVGRDDLHVYCMGSRVGGDYRTAAKVFRVVTGEGTDEEFAALPWLPLPAAVSEINRLLWGNNAT